MTTFEVTLMIVLKDRVKSGCLCSQRRGTAACAVCRPEIRNVWDHREYPLGTVTLFLPAHTKGL